MTAMIWKVERGQTVRYLDGTWTAVWGVESPDPDARIKIQRGDEVQVVPIVQVVTK